MTPPASSNGAYVFTFTTYNIFPAANATDGSVTVFTVVPPNPVNVTLQLAVTGLNISDTENTTAYKIWSQINTQLTQYGAQYSGSPIFSSQIPYPTFRTFPSSHIVSFFSESQFNITVAASGIDPGCILNIDSTPSLATCAQIAPIASINSVLLRDITGTTLTNVNLALAVKIASARLINGLRGNNIVTCGFLHEDKGNYQRSMWLRRGIPGIYFDPIRVKRPYSVSLFGTMVGDSTSVVWNYIKATGELQYIPAQNLINTYEPTFLQNEIKVSYVAGNWVIPPLITYAITTLIGSALQSRAGIRALKTGSFDVQYFPFSTLQEVLIELNNDYCL